MGHQPESIPAMQNGSSKFRTYAMSASNTRLLIIDDQPNSVGLLLAYLGDKGVDILVALDGRDGLKKAIAGQPDLILLDVTMPVLDGFKVCEQLKADSRTATIPVIFLSAADSTEDKLQGFALGAVDYIGKPFSEQEVLARVFVHLGNRQRQQEALPPDEDHEILSLVLR